MFWSNTRHRLPLTVWVLRMTSVLVRGLIGLEPSVRVERAWTGEDALVLLRLAYLAVTSVSRHRFQT